MDCESIREEIEAYALGALEERAARRVEAHLGECQECAELARAYQTTVEHMALSAPLYRAPPRLRDLVLGGIGVRPRLTPAALLGSSRWLAAAAAVFLALAVGGITWAIILSAQVNDLEKKNQGLAELTQLDEQQRAVLLRLQSELASTRNQQRQMVSTLEEQSTLIVLALDPDLIPTELQGTSLAPEAGCRYVWSTKQSIGALYCQNLPSISFALAYQLWVTRGEKTITLGAFNPRNDGSAHLLVKPQPESTGSGPMTNMWVTLEVVGNTVTRPSNEVILQKAPTQQAAR